MKKAAADNQVSTETVPNPIRRRVKTFPRGESLAKQSFKEECDINRIVDRFLSGQPVPINTRSPVYQDNFAQSYQDVQNKIIEANNEFAKLPADIRDKFNNDVQSFLEFATNPENHDQMVEMGLLEDPAKAEWQKKYDEAQKTRSDQNPGPTGEKESAGGGNGTPDAAPPNTE